MFKLVGREVFGIGNKAATKCAIIVEAAGTFAYEYTLEVNGKTYEKFREQQNKSLQTWTTDVSGRSTRICLGMSEINDLSSKIIMQFDYRQRDDGCMGEWTEDEYGRRVCRRWN